MCHDAFVLPYTAYFRIYQPVIAYSSRERAYWRAYAQSPHRPRRAEAVAAEHEESLRRLVTSPPTVAPSRESGDAYVRRSGGELFVCPWQTRLRSWLALREFRATTSARVASAFVPEAVVEAAEADAERHLGRGEDSRPQILTSRWTVPTAWFVPFGAEERCLVLGGRREWDPALEGPGTFPGEPSSALPVEEPAPRSAESAATRALLYVTEMGTARRRLERAVRVLRGVPDGEGSLAAVERLEDWLTAVAHPRALLELDYGGLVHLLGDAELRDDHSAAEVEAALTGLETGQEAVTLAAHRRLVRRWRAVQALERAN